jgi:hypothetical protein
MAHASVQVIKMSEHGSLKKISVSPFVKLVYLLHVRVVHSENNTRPCYILLTLTRNIAKRLMPSCMQMFAKKCLNHRYGEGSNTALIIKDDCTTYRFIEFLKVDRE